MLGKKKYAQDNVTASDPPGTQSGVTIAMKNKGKGRVFLEGETLTALMKKNYQIKNPSASPLEKEVGLRLRKLLRWTITDEIKVLESQRVQGGSTTPGNPSRKRGRDRGHRVGSSASKER